MLFNDEYLMPVKTRPNLTIAGHPVGDKDGGLILNVVMVQAVIVMKDMGVARKPQQRELPGRAIASLTFLTGAVDKKEMVRGRPAPEIHR